MPYKGITCPAHARWNAILFREKFGIAAPARRDRYAMSDINASTETERLPDVGIYSDHSRNIFSIAPRQNQKASLFSVPDRSLRIFSLCLRIITSAIRSVNTWK